MCGQKAVGVKVVRCGARGATGEVQNVGPICCLFVCLLWTGSAHSQYTVAECGLISRCLIPYLLAPSFGIVSLERNEIAFSTRVSLLNTYSGT